MDLERVRKQPIPGYVHPESTNVDRDSKYKTFTEGKKQKKFGTTTIGTKYSTLQTEINEEQCPTCNELSIDTCPCAYNDKKCPNSHVWYTNRGGKRVKGDPHI